MAGFDFDPFKGRDPFDLGLGGGSRQQARPEYRRPLDDEAYRSVGQAALDAGSSGVSHVLGALDKPGQAVRGVLAGKGLGSLKHLVPFSDTLGITTAKDHTSGRDLTDMAGLTDRHDKGWGSWGAGLAADVVTDPLSWTTLGAKHALTPIGKAVEKTGALKGFTGRQMLEGFHATEPELLKAGRTASDVTHLADQGKKVATGAAASTGVEAGQPLGSLARIGLPFGGPGVNIGTGKAAQTVAGGLDAAGDWLKFGNPVGRAVGSLFDSTRHGATGAATQRGAVKYLDPALQTLKAEARADRRGLIAGLDPIISAGTHGESEVTDAARAVAEGFPHNTSPTLASEVAGPAAHVRSVADRQIAEVRAAGGSIKDVGDDYAKYVHRSALAEHPGNLQMGGKGNRPQPLLTTTSGANIGRDEVFRDIPGMTGRINDWFDRFAGMKGKGAKAQVVQGVRRDLESDFLAGGGAMTPAVAKAFDDKAVAMANRLRVSNAAHRSVPATATSAAVKGKPFFTPDLVGDVTQRGKQHANTVADVHASIGIMTDHARPIQGGNPEGLIPLHTVAQKLGLKTYKADVASGKPMEGALVQIYRGLAKQGAGKVDPYLMGKTGALKAHVNRYGITPELFGELTKAHAGWNAPEQIKSSLGAWDSMTNAFRALAYPIWLPSHVRNSFTATANNARHGVGWRDYMDQLQAMTGRGTRDLSAVHPSLAGLAPAEQADRLRAMQYAQANIFGGHGMNEEISGNIHEALADGKRFTPGVPGSDRAGPHGNLVADAADLTLKQGLLGSLSATGKALGGSVAGLADPTRRWGQSVAENLGIKGVGGVAKDTLPAVAAGRKAGTNIEDFFRGALFNKLSREGHVGGNAADQINKLHFDYDALTGFEKNVMRRVMPFYTFGRKNLPLQLDTVLHQPGIIQAQSKPFTQPDPGGKGYVPRYLDSGYAFGLGPEKNGQRQYVSKLGLPAEEAFERLHFRNGLPDARRTALDYMGQLNPMIKGPLEQLMGTQFYTQRQLSDLHAPAAASAIGRAFGDDNPQLLSQVFSNSPLTRFVSSADKLMDPRKSWLQKAVNLGSGVRVTDVDTEKMRSVDTRDALQEMMAGHPNLSKYTRFYVKPEDAQGLTPEEILLMRAYTAQQEQAQAYAQAHRPGIGIPGRPGGS